MLEKGKRKKEEFWRKRAANFCLNGKGGIAIHDDQEEMGPYLIFVERDRSWARCIPKDQVETA
jgi:hypothetical protein